MPKPVSDHLRKQIHAIAKEWESRVLAQSPVLEQFDHSALVDHIPEFLHGLAAWVEGDDHGGRRGFESLAQGHALQRFGHGISLEMLSTEYQILRTVILENLLTVESSEDVRGALVRVNTGIDYAVNEAVRRYSSRRDLIRERFVGILGHDLRNPLNAVTLGAAQIASSPCGDPKHARLASTIQRSADRMTRMVADVIDFAHAHLGQGIPAVPALADLGEICEEAASELKVQSPDREIVVETSGDLRGHIDRDRAIQALSNLIGNAVQHGSGRVTVVARELPSRHAVVTAVKNAGNKIPPELARRLFDPFRAGQEGINRPRSNLGLGLYIVQQIALAHGAICTVHSTDEETSFEICWPRIPIEDTPGRDD